ncbi:hypothetical protein BO226_04790 [Rhodococcus sp. 2G]|uniref:hypothetical protein n=1 Tax=Rhodococcus sp. 2G TaxID=1570939 RepID=UPI000904238B|nr:hypothetical protein [Rhodococcus sp. 2G]APE08620.1 hypothetical protein BO226_04790 [Rhodococcus sp. 2G]
MKTRRAWRFFVAEGPSLVSPIAADRSPWAKRMTSPRCALGCDPVPGPCGHCGYTVLRDRESFIEVIDQLERNGNLIGRTIVGARVAVRGPLRFRPPLYWINLNAPEYRAGDLELEHLYLHDRDWHAADDLADRYGVPVSTPIALDTI